MKYFKNTELAKLYNISEKSVRNWIDAAQTGKLELQLHVENDRAYIANISKNIAAIEQLVAKGKKYKNTRGLKVIKPTEQFYKLYSPKQILDIISNIDIYREIPVQYTFFDGGAQRWDDYTNNLQKQETPNSLTNTVTLLEHSNEYIDEWLKNYTKVNVIDLGPGNALPVRRLLQRLIDKGMLNRYIGVDISQELLNITERNLKDWFGDRITIESHIRDIVYDRFDDLLVPELFSDTNTTTANLVLFFGGTLNNLREPDHALMTIRDSMSKNDLLIVSKKLDTETSRRYFEPTFTSNHAIELVMQLLNIDKAYYTVEHNFDEKKMARELRARLNLALTIEFELDGHKRIIELNKDDRILLWRAWHHSPLQAMALLEKSGFEFLQAGRSQDMDYLLTISKLRIDRDR